LQLLAQISYQGIIQLAVPLFFGIFSRFGNKQGALLGMMTGIIIAIVLTVFFPDDIPALGSLTSGIVGLAGNVAMFVVCGLLIPVDDKEKARVEALFALADGVKAPVAKPLMN
jgi:hypothetical protein